MKMVNTYHKQAIEEAKERIRLQEIEDARMRAEGQRHNERHERRMLDIIAKSLPVYKPPSHNE